MLASYLTPSSLPCPNWKMLQCLLNSYFNSWAPETGRLGDEGWARRCWAWTTPTAPGPGPRRRCSCKTRTRAWRNRARPGATRAEITEGTLIRTSPTMPCSQLALKHFVPVLLSLERRLSKLCSFHWPIRPHLSRVYSQTVTKVRVT